MKINEVFKEYLEQSGGITIYDNRKDEKLVLPDELKKKIEDFITKNYGKEEYNEDLLIDYPFNEIDVTNNVHSYASKVSRSYEYGNIFIEKIEGDTVPGEYDPDYNGIKSPDFSMDKIQISEISQPNSSLINSNLAIYIPDEEKKEIGSFKEKYGNTFLRKEDKSYYDNTKDREPRKITIDELFPSKKEQKEDQQEEEKTNNTDYISVEKLDSFSKNASRQKINEFLDEAIKEINSQNKEI